MVAATPVPVAARITTRLREGRELDFAKFGLETPLSCRDIGKEPRFGREASLRHLAHVQPTLRRLMKRRAVRVTPPITNGHWQAEVSLHILSVLPMLWEESQAQGAGYLEIVQMDPYG